MVVLSTGVVVILVVIAVVLVLVLLILLICCLCRKCEQCARWSRRSANAHEEAAKEREMSDGRREFEEIRAQHNVAREQLRVKYNLNTGGNSDAVVIS